MHIGIIGAGFSGCMLAVHLLRRAGEKGIEISLIESGADIGRGVAYGPDSAGHLLNVRAANMSAFADDPSHFLRWLARQENTVLPGTVFLSRRLYGDYVASILQETVEAYPGSKVSIVKQAAVELHPGAQPAVTLADGSRLHFDKLALCLGNFPPAPLGGVGADALASGKYLNDRRHWSALRRIAPDDDVLILGSGLTMADALQTLGERGHRGAIHIISRHGLLPVAHEAVRPYELAPLSGSVLEIFVKLRRAVACARDHNWRDVVDAFRPAVRGIWQAWPLDQRRRFLRHVRPYWDLHRHRLPPVVAAEMEALIAAGRLRITAAYIQTVSWQDERFDVAYRPRGTDRICHAHPAWVINCTGPQSDYGNIPDGLVQTALAKGVIRPDALKLGIAVTDENRVIGRNGNPSPNIVALGPPTKGVFWEITAVPDLRVDCARMADLLTAGV